MGSRGSLLIVALDRVQIQHHSPGFSETLVLCLLAMVTGFACFCMTSVSLFAAFFAPPGFSTHSAQAPDLNDGPSTITSCQGSGCTFLRLAPKESSRADSFPFLSGGARTISEGREFVPKNADSGPSYGKYAVRSKLRISYTKTCMKKIKHATSQFPGIQTH